MCVVCVFDFYQAISSSVGSTLGVKYGLILASRHQSSTVCAKLWTDMPWSIYCSRTGSFRKGDVKKKVSSYGNTCLVVNNDHLMIFECSFSRRVVGRDTVSPQSAAVLVGPQLRNGLCHPLPSLLMAVSITSMIPYITCDIRVDIASGIRG